MNAANPARCFKRRLISARNVPCCNGVATASESKDSIFDKLLILLAVPTDHIQ
jgi:hypothetical protein